MAAHAAPFPEPKFVLPVAVEIHCAVHTDADGTLDVA